MKMKMFAIVLFLSVLILLQGCMSFIASQFAYHEANGRYTRLYNDYKSEQEAKNLERDKSGLGPKPIMEYHAWLKTQTLTNKEIKVFEYYGVISKEEAGEIRAGWTPEQRAAQDLPVK